MRRLTFILPLFRLRSEARHRVPSGLLSLAAEALAAGHVAVKVIDAESSAWSAAEVAESLAAEKPDAIGVSVCSPCFSSCLELVRVVRSKMPDVLIILGGKHVTHCWHAVVQAGIQADALVRGEGEAAVGVLARALAADADRKDTLSALAKLPNVWVPGKTSAPILPPPVDLGQAPPWQFEVLVHGLEYYRGDRMLVEFSRGCPGRCSYCLASRDRQRLSFRPTSQVLETLAHLCVQGFQSFFFTDDDFAASPKFLKHLLKGIIESDLAIEFDANVRPDSLVKCADLAPLLRRAGCRCLWVGIESGSAAILESYGKGFNVDTCERAVEVALSAAEIVRTNWIIGSPLETAETVDASVELAKRFRQRLGPHIPHVSYMVPYPGTPICDEALALGLITNSRLDRLSDTTHGEPIMPSRYLSMDQLKELFRQFHLGYFDSDFFTTAPPAVATEARLVLHSASLGDKRDI